MKEGLTRISLKEGTVNFWLKPETIQWESEEETPLFKAGSDEGSLVILKRGKVLEVFYGYIPLGTTTFSVSMESFKLTDPHLVTLTWNSEKKELLFYIDATLVKQQAIL